MSDPIPMIRMICMYAALAIAVVCIAKILGVNIPIRAATTELAAIGILCALVGR